MASLILIIVLILGGGASLAAEQAVPGDALYPLKISVNENVRAAASLSAEAKAGWDARVAERRLEEAERLTAQEKLSAQVREQIETNFEAHADRTQARIAEFQSRGELSVAADVASQFEMSLLVHEQILARLAAEKPSVAAEVESLLVEIRAEAQETSQLRAEVEASLTTDVSAGAKTYSERARREAEEAISETRMKVERLKASLSVTLAGQAASRLESADRLMAQAEARANAGAYGEAVILFFRAKQSALQASVLLEAGENLRVDLDGGAFDLKVAPEPEKTPEASTRTETQGGAQVQGEAEVRVNY